MLAVNEEGLPTGHYRQNVDHYVFMQGDDETEDGSESVDTEKEVTSVLRLLQSNCQMA